MIVRYVLTRIIARLPPNPEYASEFERSWLMLAEHYISVFLVFVYSCSLLLCPTLILYDRGVLPQGKRCFHASPALKPA